MLDSLKDFKVLITGATGAIGSSLSFLLHQLGAHITITGTRLEALDRISSELGSKVHAIQCDMSEPESADKLVDQAAEAMGGIDGLVCNAGITRDALSLRINQKKWDEVLQINLSSPFFLNKAACKFMMRAKHGSIVNVSSVVAFSGNPGQVNYVASKAGLVGMTKSMALEFAQKNIRINCVAPGFIQSPMTDKVSQISLQRIKSNIAMQRIGQPQEIANAIAFLLSDASSYITGETLHINGGLLMK